jgi:hypothetical protein
MKCLLCQRRIRVAETRQSGTKQRFACLKDIITICVSFCLLVGILTISAQVPVCCRNINNICASSCLFVGISLISAQVPVACINIIYVICAVPVCL